MAPQTQNLILHEQNPLGFKIKNKIKTYEAEERDLKVKDC